MKKVTLFVMAILSSLFMLAQNETDTIKNWKIGGESSLTFSQVSLINWAAGGESSVSGNTFLNLNANYARGKNIWENKLELAYGLMKQGEQDVKKTNDKLSLASSYGYEATKKWYYIASLTFNSQFSDGYNYPNDSVLISSFLAPAYVLAALGMEYKPNEVFSVMILPVSGRLTIVNDDSLSAQGAFGVEPGNKTRFEFGGTLKMEIQKEIMKNVSLQSNLQLFSNYLDKPQNIDVNWEAMLNMKINDYLSANLSTTLIYDHDIKITDKDGNTGPRVQFKEVFGVGFSYKF
ncbi:MAG: DUF3078 domain-containing protein [Bacteroidales bacterium]|nr:DUF3078 domain-containing protein [Bacteroidales bacterium]MCF8349665.1 DUF3078 domain-containing protein [Bacteroidales bacterium]MCF8374911.1 DUF3078 domain-containing protein [Bacteroidales bacterium]MCF8400110.1 DUF3078 domain-containing protein [Bacteroidales bacterium]